MKKHRFYAGFRGVTLLLLATLIFNQISFASVDKDEKFNPAEMIMHHIGDAHDWHIMDIGDHSISIPLPVIVFHQGKGLSFFMSSNFHHGAEGYNNYWLDHEKIVYKDSEGVINEEETAKIWDFSITKNVATLFISVLFLIWLFTKIAKTYKNNTGKAPRGIQGALEPLILFVRDDIAKASIGEKYYKKFVPFLLTVFFFIWFNNLLGLIPIAPGGANLTGNIAVTMVLALFTFIITTMHGNKHYWRHIFAMPGVPIGVLVILTPIEIMGVFLKPFVLMIRLFANITAGHIIALAFFSLIFLFGEMNAGAGYGAAIFSVSFSIFMTCLELLVALIQAYVFTLLSAMYFGMAVEEHH